MVARGPVGALRAARLLHLGTRRGRSRDFLTSPEIGPVFAAVVARAVDGAWIEAGRPDPWFVVEVGAGAGSLARSFLAAAPACRAALRYIAVEVSPALRAAAASRLPLEDPSQLLGPRTVADRDDPDADPEGRRGLGPLVAVLGELPAGLLTGVVIANELLDNLPFDIYEWAGAEAGRGWSEVRVGETGGELVEVLVPAAVDVADALETLVPSPRPGARVPWEAAAASWVRAAEDLLARGRIIAVDYARTTAVLAAVPITAWLRTYRSGGPGKDALSDLGSQDLTVDVALDQLPGPSRVETQAAWLARYGVDELVAQAAGVWQERAAIGDLEALRARSVAQEVAALTDPAGLGGFTVVEWDR